MEDLPSVTTCKDVEKSVDIDHNDDDDRKNGQNDNEEDVKDGNESDTLDGHKEDGRDNDGGDGHNANRKDNQDGNGGNAPDVNFMQSGEAEKGKSTFPIIVCMMEAEKRVRHTISTLPIDVTSVNILEYVLANLFNAFDIDHTIAIVFKTHAVLAISTTLAKPYINPNTLF